MTSPGLMGDKRRRKYAMGIFYLFLFVLAGMELLNFFMHGVLIAVGAKLFQLNAAGGIPTIFLRRVSRASNPQAGQAGPESSA